MVVRKRVFAPLTPSVVPPYGVVQHTNICCSDDNEEPSGQDGTHDIFIFESSTNDDVHSLVVVAIILVVSGSVVRTTG